MSWAAVGGAAIGAAGSLLGSSKAKKAQKKASKNALALQESQYNTTREDNMPALQARNNALAQMQTLAQKYGGGMPTAEQVMAQPGYQFGLTEGRNALEGSAASRGGLYSGKAMKDLTKWGNDYGTTKYGDAFNQMQQAQTNDFNRYASIAGNGQTGVSTIANAGQNYANNGSNIQTGYGNAAGASAIANANTLGNFANQAGSALGGWWNSKSAPSSYQIGGNSFGSSPEGYYADGGPVIDPNATYSAPYMAPMQMPRVRRGIQPVRPMYRGMRSEPAYADGGPVMEPQVGTKAPVREGGGGGLSKNALLLLLINKNIESRKQQRGVNALNPRAVNAEREERVGLAGGGPVQGPGGPREDAIPARLSNGEHVIDEESVTALGDGDNMLGQLKLNGLRAMLKGAY